MLILIFSKLECVWKRGANRIPPKFNFFLLKINFLYVLDRFNILISKIIFKNKKILFWYISTPNRIGILFRGWTINTRLLKSLTKCTCQTSIKFNSISWIKKWRLKLQAWTPSYTILYTNIQYERQVYVLFLSFGN